MTTTPVKIKWSIKGYHALQAQPHQWTTRHQYASKSRPQSFELNAVTWPLRLRHSEAQTVAMIAGTVFCIV